MSPKQHFNEINIGEISSVLSQVIKEKIKLFAWNKGEKKQYQFLVVGFNEKLKKIQLEALSDCPLSGQIILFNFSCHGPQYFSSAMIDTNVGNSRVMTLDGPFYKCERREHYRLKLGVVEKAAIYFNLSKSLAKKYQQEEAPKNVEEPVVQEGNLLMFPGTEIKEEKSKKSSENTTAIMKGFLQVIESQEDEGQAVVYHQNRDLSQNINGIIIDLSITGLAVEVGPQEFSVFSKGMELLDLILIIGKEKIVIPQAKIVYLADLEKHRSTEEGGKKLAINFVNLSNDLDRKLAQLINLKARKIDLNNEFENLNS